MNKIKKYFFLLVGCGLLITNGYALNKNSNNNALMTVKDLKERTFSNVTLTNANNQPVTVAGLFIASFDVNDCSSCFGGIVGGDNLGGAVISPVAFAANQTLPIGQNFLYNMLYSGIYYIKQTAGTSPCSLPGCSWPGDDPSVHGWCISINAVSRSSNYTYSTYTNGSNQPANSPPYSAAGNSTPFNYKYDLIDPSTLGVGNACIGPITCDDQSLTCKVAIAQNEKFQAY